VLLPPHVVELDHQQRADRADGAAAERRHDGVYVGELLGQVQGAHKVEVRRAWRWG
jgi:hypothetical protein